MITINWDRGLDSFGILVGRKSLKANPIAASASRTYTIIAWVAGAGSVCWKRNARNFTVRAQHADSRAVRVSFSTVGNIALLVFIAYILQTVISSQIELMYSHIDHELSPPLFQTRKNASASVLRSQRPHSRF